MMDIVPSQNEAYKIYRDSFLGSREGPYALQHPNQEWRTRYKQVSDRLILEGHLNRKYWVGVKSPWYPKYAIIDIDHPSHNEKERVLEELKIGPGQHVVCTSPSWNQDGNVHILFKPRFNDEPATHKIFTDVLKPHADRLEVELYPQIRRKIRLPFGRDQHIIDDYGRPMNDLCWQDALYWCDKIDPVEISELPGHLPVLAESNRKHPHIQWGKTEEIQGLITHGLQAKGTRHKCCYQIAVYLYRSNYPPEQAINWVQRWIRKNHNGFSNSVNKGKWKSIDMEIERQVNCIWENYPRRSVYPDNIHNLEGWVTLGDIVLIREVFHGDIDNQKRLFKLISYYRPRHHHDWVYIPSRRWFKIANERHYLKFRSRLEEIGLLDVNNSYRHAKSQPSLSYPKSFKLRIPAASATEMISENGRSCQDYYRSLNSVFSNVRDRSEFTGVCLRNFQRNRA